MIAFASSQCISCMPNITWNVVVVVIKLDTSVAVKEIVHNFGNLVVKYGLANLII